MTNFNLIKISKHKKHNFKGFQLKTSRKEIKIIQHVSNKQKFFYPTNIFLLKELHFMLKRLIVVSGKILFVNTTKDELDISFVTRAMALEANYMYIVKRWYSGAITNSKIIRARYSWFEGLDSMSNFYFWPHLIFLLNFEQNHVCVAEAKKYRIPVLSVLNSSQYNKKYPFINYPIFSENANLFSTQYYYSRYILELIFLLQE